MAQTSVTVQASDAETARVQGAMLLGAAPFSVLVAPAGDGNFTVSLPPPPPPPVTVHVAADRMAAFLEISLPPSGGPSLVSLEEVLAALERENVVFGIDREQIRLALAGLAQVGAGEKGVCIARGQKSSPGQDGRVELRVGVGAANTCPEAADMVRPGQVVAVLIPPGPGIAGRTVLGEEIPARPGEERSFAVGANVRATEDGLGFLAEIYGKAIVSREGLLVANPVEVAEDGMSAWLPLCPRLADNSSLELSHVLASLAAAGVVHGILEAEIAAALVQGEAVARFQAARGTPVVNGRDGSLRFGFRLNNDDPRAVAAAVQEGRLAAEEIVRDLVLPGEVLVRKTPPQQAVDGRTVTGEVVAGAAPADPSVLVGENVAVQEDGLVLAVADTLVAGYADYADNVVSVADPMRVADDRMQVFMEIHPPGREGRGLTGELVVGMLKQHQVIHGINKTAIKNAVTWAAEKKKPLHNVVVARGVPPVRGRDAWLEQCVSLEKTAGRLFAETDRIDFRERSLLNTVSKGDVLVRKIPAEKGVDGHDVLGRPLPAEPGADVELVPHTNVAASEDGLALVAEVDGMVSLVDRERLAVFEIFEVKGDVDYSTGNLEMRGSLVIKGWVRTGFTVQATGDIHIGGGVEDAIVLAGGGVVVAGGVVCRDLGRIRAGGDVTARFFEQARVQADGNIFVHDLIMRSTVFARGMISAVSGKGRIRGGVVSALQGIEANEAGSEAGVKTVLMAGTHPGLRRRLAELDVRLAGYRRERAKMDTVLGRYLAGSKGTALPRELARKLSLLGKQRRNLVLAEARLAGPREEMARQLAAIDPARVRIMIKKAVYANTTVVLCGAVHRVIEDIRRPVVFRLDGEGRKVVVE